MKNLRLIIQATILSLAAMCGSTLAAGYPERAITLIVPFPPGGGTDLSARQISPYIEKYMPSGTKIVIVNKPGAGSEIGLLELINSKPDGYTIGFFNVPNTLMKAHERPNRWNIDSFLPITNLVFDPALMATRADSPLKSAADVVAAAKKNPGKLTVSSAGAGSNTHLDFIALERAAKIKMVHIPFEGGAQARNAVLGGHTDLWAGSLGDSLRFIKEGKVRPIGIYTKARMPNASDIPTFAEQGIPIEGGSARGLIGPKGMPQEAIDMIALAAAKALKDPELLKKSDDIGLPLRYMDTSEYAKYLHDSDKEIADIWKNAPWK
jgi:tripartite-type tricarboxylate transporter receptor subunit TctC